MLIQKDKIGLYVSYNGMIARPECVIRSIPKTRFEITDLKENQKVSIEKTGDKLLINDKEIWNIENIIEEISAVEEVLGEIPVLEEEKTEKILNIDKK